VKTLPTISHISLSVLGYEEEGEWVAHALEMDLRGYGKTFSKAVRDLLNLVESQIRFAQFKNQPELIYKQAEPRYWDILGRLKEERIKSLARRKHARPKSEYDAASIDIPPAWMIKSHCSPYCQPDG